MGPKRTKERMKMEYGDIPYPNYKTILLLLTHFALWNSKYQ